MYVTLFSEDFSNLKAWSLKKDFIWITTQLSGIESRTFLETLTHLFLMHPFLPPENITKTLQFYVLRGVEKGCIGNEWVKLFFLFLN